MRDVVASLPLNGPIVQDCGEILDCREDIIRSTLATRVLRCPDLFLNLQES